MTELTREQRARMWRWWNTEGCVDYIVSDIFDEGRQRRGVWRRTICGGAEHIGIYDAKNDLVEAAFLHEESGRI